MITVCNQLPTQKFLDEITVKLLSDYIITRQVLRRMPPRTPNRGPGGVSEMKSPRFLFPIVELVKIYFVSFSTVKKIFDGESCSGFET